MSGYRYMGRNLRKELQARRIFLEPKLREQRSVFKAQQQAQRAQLRSQQSNRRRGNGSRR